MTNGCPPYFWQPLWQRWWARPGGSSPPRVELIALDWRFRVRELLGRVPFWSPELVIVAIDEESARYLTMKVPTPPRLLGRPN